jgi:HSP20 family molecular chaperone IbpA
VGKLNIRHYKDLSKVKKSFERKFELNDKIDKTAIAANYENGILIVSLPKLEGHEIERQAIEIA